MNEQMDGCSVGGVNGGGTGARAAACGMEGMLANEDDVVRLKEV